MPEFKRATDVHFAVSIAKAKDTTKPITILLTHSADEETHATKYYDIFDLVDDYPENGTVYPEAEAIFDTDNFEGPLEVVEVPNTDIAIPYNVKSTPTADGAKITADLMPGVLYGMSQHLYDGAYYAVCAADITDDEVQLLAEYLYAKQRILLVTDVADLATLRKNFNYAQANQQKINTLGNWYNNVNSQKVTLKQAAQIAAYAAANVPTDLQHIGNQTTFAQDPAVYAEDLDAIEELNGSTVVNKGDDLMMLRGKTLAGNWADQFVHTQMAVDALTDCLQTYENRNNFPSYDDAHINEMEKTLETTGKDLLAKGILASEITIETKPRAQVPTAVVESREYNYFVISLEVAGAIDTINGKVKITI